MTFTQIIDKITVWGSANLPIVIGAGVAIVVLLVMLLSRRGRGKGLDLRKLTAASSPNAVLAEKAANWAPPEQSYADRRVAVRREGPPVRVFLASPMLRGGTTEGYVLDRSTGGLRIAVAAAISPGSLVQVRAANAPDNVGFVTIIIRSCRETNDFFELGCEFESTPPWSVLLLFG